MRNCVFNTARRQACAILHVFALLLGTSLGAFAQTDQGTITGTVVDSSGAVVPGAGVTLTSADTGFTLTRQTSPSGVYTFSPVKIGNYNILVSAPGFAQMKRDRIHLDIQQRLQVDFELKLGTATQVVDVTSAPSLMQSEDASTGQVVSAKTIDATPLNGRNWVFIAQLTAGIAPANGARGAGKGDFNANGQRAEQNNFILDGVDNNTNVVDFLNGASFVVRPPPDALAEFKVQTGAYSAEFGHSAGAVVNASIKSGTNDVHGDLWEYWRNDVLDARDYFAKSVPEYRQNQFGATLGLPILKISCSSSVMRKQIGSSSTRPAPTTAFLRPLNGMVTFPNCSIPISAGRLSQSICISQAVQILHSRFPVTGRKTYFVRIKSIPWRSTS